MIINGCVVTGKITESDLDIILAVHQFLDENCITDNIENETLGYLSKDVHKIEVLSDDEDDFEVTVTRPGNDHYETYRFISEAQIDNIFSQACDEKFDDDAWREDVAGYGTEDGLEEWQQYKQENASPAEVLSTYDEEFHDELDCGWNVFRV